MVGPSRREVLGSLGVASAVAGCLGSLTEQEREPPDYDCDAASRPDPSAPDDEDAVEPLPYPDAEALLDGTEGVVEYERAYRRNSLVASEGSSLVDFGVSNADATEYDAPEGANVVRIEYEFYYETDGPDGITTHDSPTVYASYYVDESVVVRTESRGHRSGDDLDPDPWEGGETIECVE